MGAGTGYYPWLFSVEEARPPHLKSPEKKLRS